MIDVSEANGFAGLHFELPEFEEAALGSSSGQAIGETDRCAAGRYEQIVFACRSDERRYDLVRIVPDYAKVRDFRASCFEHERQHRPVRIVNLSGCQRSGRLHKLIPGRKQRHFRLF